MIVSLTRVLICGLCVLVLSMAPAVAKQPKRPNVLVLLTDDQRWDTLSCTGHPVLKTPHIDRLAAEGVTFDNAFVTTAICCISRASFITGRYCRNHKVGDFSTPLAPDMLADSYPAILKRAGYRTGCLGKWGLGGVPPRELFDTWNAWGGQGEYFDTIDGERVHNSEMLARKAIGFLRNEDGGGDHRPFCLLIYYKSPHDPYLPDPRDAELFKDTIFPKPATYNDAHFATLPEFIRASEGRKRFRQINSSAEAYQEHVRQYLRCVAGVDRSVGQILAASDALKLSDSTVIAYTADNGFFLGEHGLTHKWLMHEESIRVPMIIRDPRLPAARRGQRCPQLALNIDLAPTLVELAGLPPRAADGRSLVPLLEGRPTEWRKDFFYEHHFDNSGTIPRTEGVRTADWKYMTYYDVRPAFEELYDLKNDPHEEQNLAGDPAHRATLQQLRATYRQYVEKLPPPVRPTRKPM